jgi:hypothetical protein
MDPYAGIEMLATHAVDRCRQRRYGGGEWYTLLDFDYRGVGRHLRTMVGFKVLGVPGRWRARESRWTRGSLLSWSYRAGSLRTGRSPGYN